MIEHLINIVLLGFLAVTAIAVLRTHNLFAAAMLSGIYSLVTAVLFVVLDAVDVAFTEAAVGAGIATILMLGTLALTRREQTASHAKPGVALILVLLTAGALIYGTYDMPFYGDPDAPAHRQVALRYLNETPREIGIPNVVTAVLASYRGYDTLGEVAVIFTAGVAVLALLGRGRRRRTAGPERASPVARPDRE